MAIEKFKTGGRFGLPTRQHRQSSPFTSKMEKIGQISQIGQIGSVV
jgi:hypothetical protein